jgi:hypothetical protein
MPAVEPLSNDDTLKLSVVFKTNKINLNIVEIPVILQSLACHVE